MTILKNKDLPTIQPIQNILSNKYPQLGNIIEKAQQLEQLNNLFHSTLDTDLATHCQLAKFEQGEMVLIVDNAAWATRLRYTTPDTIKILSVQPEFHNLRTIRYKIKTKNVDTDPAPTKTQKKPEEKRRAKELHNLAAKIA